MIPTTITRWLRLELSGNRDTLLKSLISPSTKMINSNLNAILFDLDNTLIDRSTAVHGYFSSLLQRAAPHLSPRASQQTLQEIKEHDQLGYSERPIFFQWLADHHFPHWTSQKLWNDFAENLPQYIQPEPNCLTLLDQLQQRYALAVVTNGSVKVQRAKLKASHIDQHVDHIFISGETEFEKPDPQLFQLALQSLSVSSDQALYIGDHPQADMVGAIHVGMQACWISLNREFPVELPQPHYQIPSIHSLRSLLP